MSKKVIKGEVTIHFHNEEEYKEITTLITRLGLCCSVKLEGTKKIETK